MSASRKRIPRDTVRLNALSVPHVWVAFNRWIDTGGQANTLRSGIDRFMATMDTEEPARPKPKPKRRHPRGVWRHKKYPRNTEDVPCDAECAGCGLTSGAHLCREGVRQPTVWPLCMP